MNIVGFDHLVLTVADVAKTTRFYTEVLGMTAVMDDSRYELHFGSQKINLHSCPGQFQPAATRPASGTADFCLVAKGPMNEIVEQVRKVAAIELGPVTRAGAQGTMTSVYLRDPDGNLVEISVYE